MAQNDSMNYNFDILESRIIDSLKLTNISKKLKKIKGSTICVGSGGSNVVASFASLVLNAKNGCCVKISEPRDVLYENLKNYKNLFICSYSGNNHGVNILSPLKIKKHLLTYGTDTNKNFNKLKCNYSIPKEMSFISLGATLMPMSILLSYYLNKDISPLIEHLIISARKQRFNISSLNLPYDIMSGQDTLTPERYLESTFTESGLSACIVHRKYDFCHGRSTLAYKQKRNLIYLIANKKQLDDLLLSSLKDRYQNIIVLESNYNDLILDNFNLTIQALYLTKKIAKAKEIDLSIVDYDKELCKKLYKYSGGM